MPITTQDIRNWLTLEGLGRKSHHTHMFVICDTFDYEDYPVYTSDPSATYTRYNGQGMQKIMEIYDLSMDFEKQLAEYRSWHL